MHGDIKWYNLEIIILTHISNYFFFTWKAKKVAKSQSQIVKRPSKAHGYKISNKLIIVFLRVVDEEAAVEVVVVEEVSVAVVEDEVVAEEDQEEAVEVVEEEVEVGVDVVVSKEDQRCLLSLTDMKK
ncbi:hypothetical protein P5673_001590 [Acropora cervicornis]|uniref:Uncharacterized protein n=1 Tax=Acropora cervicornis TaxID=6130 RepID=A0AAD9R6A5_ACRCE|nr:hypothetical protein P5673_001590 [Acropora cervicornis]